MSDIGRCLDEIPVELLKGHCPVEIGALDFRNNLLTDLVGKGLEVCESSCVGFVCKHADHSADGNCHIAHSCA